MQSDQSALGIRNEDAFGNLELKPVRLQPGDGQRLHDRCRQARAGKLLGGDIHRHPNIGRPLGGDFGEHCFVFQPDDADAITKLL